ncbi:MAG TPA: hypothetical protein PKA80_03580 [Ignavibacteriaceae bacterium]|nr:hypothetical protein [Ignavibacteriaceae bacterium]
MKQIIKQLFETNCDPESLVYSLMNKMKIWEDDITHLKLYPSISEVESFLIELEKNNIFGFDRTITNKLQNQRDKFSKGIVDSSIIKPQNSNDLNLKISEWFFPSIKTLHEEARVIEEFVSENLHIKNINPAAKYRGKGYLLIDDQNSESLYIYKYEIIFKWIDTDPTQIVSLLLLRSIPIELVESSVERLAADFVRTYDEILNPAVYLCETNLILPFKATILPVAKNSLLQIIKD